MLMATKNILTLCKVTDIFFDLTLNLLTTTIVAPPSNASKWQMGFNSAFIGLKINFADSRQISMKVLNIKSQFNPSS